MRFTNPAKRRLVLPLACLLAAATIGGCSSELEDGGGEWESPDGWSDTSGWQDTGTTTDTYVPPPETELQLQQPEAARDFVFVASTNLDSVAKIDAETLEIESIAVGDQPTIVRTRPSNNTAAVLNLGSADVTVIHANRDADDVIARVKVDRHLNAMRITPSGDHVVLYYDESLSGPDDPVGSFQLLDVVRIVAGKESMVSLTVSFHVRDVQFDERTERAYVITDDFLHIIDLSAVVDDPAGYDPADRISLVEGGIGSVQDREVAITPDGRFAVLRSVTFSGLVVIALEDGTTREIPFSAPPTDVDLLRHGDGVLAVVRDTAELVIVGLPDAFDDPTDVRIVQAPDTIPIGQAIISREGCSAIVFSTAVRSATIGELDLCSAELTAHRLGSGKPIAGAALSPSGRWVFVKHEADITSPDPIQWLHGFSVVEFRSPLNGGNTFDKLFQTDAAPGPMVFTPDDAHLFTLVNERVADLRQVVHVELDTLHAVTDTLGSPPVLIGALPAAQRVYVGQEHPVGRISFIEVATGRIQTVTGFELNSRIR